MFHWLFPLLLFVSPQTTSPSWIEFDGSSGPGKGKHIVFVTGDEEYRSEEGMPQLAKILAQHHGFRTTVLFAIHPETGAIDPDVLDNIPGLEKLAKADLLVIFTRFRDLPDSQMRHIVDYIDSGKPVVGLRTATHAFFCKKHKTYERYSWNHKPSDGGFGRTILGETWISHHGAHGSESCRGILVEKKKEHPILRGIRDGDIWDPADVYGVRLPLPEGTTPLVLGQVLAGMKPDSPAVESQKNSPMMPIAWTRYYQGKSGKTGRVFTTTLGSARAFLREGSRRLLVNACYWALGLEKQIRPDSSVTIVGEFDPPPFGFGKHRRGIKPAQHGQTESPRQPPK